MDTAMAEIDVFAAARGCFEEMLGWLEGTESAQMSHAELEEEMVRRGREVQRLAFQDHIDLRALRERRVHVVDADGVTHAAVEAGHNRQLSTVVGTVRVERIAYRHLGSPNLHPADAALNLPDQLHSHGLRRLAAVESTRGSFDEAAAAIERGTGVAVAKRQVEFLSARAATDIEEFYATRTRTQADETDVLVISADGKGIVMRPDSLRPATAKAAAAATTKLTTRLSKGEKRNRKRLAEVGAVYDVSPVPRSAQDVMASKAQNEQPPEAPRAKNKWVTASVVEDAAEVVGRLFDEADRRDPDHTRTWVALVDGNNHQIERIGAEATSRGVEVRIVCDLVHVIEYLWASAWCFFSEGEAAAEDWVRDRVLAVLQGNARVNGPRGSGRYPPTRDGLWPCQGQTQQGRRRGQVPGEQGALPRLPASTRLRVADRNRSDRRSLPLPGGRSHGHHRRTLERPRCRGSPQATSGPGQRRLRRLLALPPRPRTPARPQVALRPDGRPPRRVVTPRAPHPDHFDPGPLRRRRYVALALAGLRS